MLGVRCGTDQDYDQIMTIYRYAQDYMIQSGNPDQWGHFYPDPELVKSDIQKGLSKVIFDDECIHGVFAVLEGEDPTYQYIGNGKWLNAEPYVTIHRIAGDGYLSSKEAENTSQVYFGVLLFFNSFRQCLIHGHPVKLSLLISGKFLHSVFCHFHVLLSPIISVLNPLVSFYRTDSLWL